MDKHDLIEQMAADTGFTKVKAGIAIDAIIKVITEALKNGGTVKLPGIGSFFVTGSKFEMVYQEEKDDIPSKKKVKFIADKKLLSSE